MTAARTPTTSSSSPRPPGRGERTLARLGLSAREAFVSVLAVGLALFWLVYLVVLYAGAPGPDAVAATDAAGAGAPWAFDLAAYVNAARRLIEDGSLYAAGLVAGSFEPGPADLFYYAPPLGVAMLPFTEMVLDTSALVWWAVRIAALGLACALMPVRPVIRALAFAVVAFSLPGLKDSLLGNVSLLLLLPLVAGWRWMDRPLGSMALAAAMSVRPSLGVFLIWQLLRRQWRAAAWTIGAGIGLVLLTLPFVGIEGYRDYLSVMGNLNVPAGLSENRDLGGTAIALGADASLAGVARLVSIGIGALGILVSLRRDREISYMVVLSASLLLVPLLWDHYLATLVLPAAFLAQRWHVAFIALPLLSWLAILTPLLVVAAMILPLVVRDESAVPATRDGVIRPLGEPGHA